MRREDVILNESVRLVVLRQHDDHFLRLLVPKDGRPTFVTGKLPLAPEDYLGLAQTEDTYRCYAGDLLVMVQPKLVIVKLGEFVMSGQRSRLVAALNAVAV